MIVNGIPKKLNRWKFALIFSCILITSISSSVTGEEFLPADFNTDFFAPPSAFTASNLLSPNKVVGQDTFIPTDNNTPQLETLGVFTPAPAPAPTDNNTPQSETLDTFTPAPAIDTLVPFDTEKIELAKTAAPIMLDSSKIVYPEFNVDFMNPSEYKSKTYKKEGNEVVPVEEPQKESEQTTLEPIDEKDLSEQDGVKKEENDFFTPVPNENNAVLERSNNLDKDNSAENYFPFKKPAEFVSPSEYKIMLQNKEAVPAVPDELIPEYSYQAGVNKDIPDDVMDGRTITSIKITGNNKVSDDVILEAIKSNKGTLFNTELLQSDLQRIYMLGYFTENMSIEPEVMSDGSVELVFSVEENVLVKDIQINGNTVYSNAELMATVGSLKGMPQNIDKINEAIKKINDKYNKDGYILAHVKSIDDNKDGVLIINVSEGIIDKFEFNEDKKTKDYVIERNILTKPGSVYNEEVLKQDITRLYATQIFDDIERIIEPCPNKDGEYIVKINVKEASSNSVSIGGGIDSALGVFGQVGVSEKNLFGRGQFLGLSGMIGSGILLSDASIKNRMNFNIELNFREPYFLNSDTALAGKAYYRDLGSYQIPLAIEKRFGANAVVTHKIKGSDKLKATLGLGYEHIHLSEGDPTKIASIYKLNNVSMSERTRQLTGGSFINIAPGIIYGNVDDEFMPRKGLIAKASYIESVGLSHSNNTNGRLVGKVTKYIPLFKKSSLALTAKTGVRIHGDMPEVMAFGLGGPYSIRGFRMNGVGTGNAFWMASAELQTPIPFFDRFKYDILKNMRFATFIDGGRLYDSTLTSRLYDRPLKAASIGIGLRIYIPGVGPLSIDYALPLTHTGKYNPNGGYFTFGTSGIYDNY